jgi:hypothetical protein
MDQKNPSRIAPDLHLIDDGIRRALYRVVDAFGVENAARLLAQIARAQGSTAFCDELVAAADREREATR